MRTTFNTISAAVASLAMVSTAVGAEEKVTVSKLSIHRQGSPVGDSIPSASFHLKGLKTADCSGTDIPYPTPEGSVACDNDEYAFLLLPGEKSKTSFQLMVYHDVGDRKADLRGMYEFDLDCDNSNGSGPADETCTQKEPVSFTIDGPVDVAIGGGSDDL